MPDTIHVYPLNDIIEHKTDDIDCICLPTVKEVEGGTIIVHNSFDGREDVEKQQEIARLN
jgi:hypothetical protein